MEGSSSTTGRSEPAEGAGPGGSADQWEASALLVVRQGSRWRGRDDSCSADQWECERPGLPDWAGNSGNPGERVLVRRGLGGGGGATAAHCDQWDASALFVRQGVPPIG